MKTLLLILPVILLGYWRPVLANMEDIEAAIIREDFHQAQESANSLLANKNLEPLIFIEAAYYLGLSHIHLGNFAQAREAFDQVIKNQPPKKWQDKAYIGLYDAYYLDGDFPKAKKVILKLLQISPQSEVLSLIYLKLARVNLKLARWEEARAQLKKIPHDYPESFEAHLARQLLEEKQYFSVQVGAFMDQKFAEELTAELKQKKEYAYIVETVDSMQRKFYRVRVGQTARLDDAQKLKSRLSGLGYPTKIYP